MVTGNQHAIKARLGKISKYREGLEAFRADVIKADALGKSLKASNYTGIYKLGGSFVQALLKVKAMEDKEPGVYGSGKYRWTYNGNPTGIVDQPLIERVIDKENEMVRKTNKEKRELARVGVDSLPGVENVRKLPSKDGGLDKIIEWIDGEMSKNNLVPGYLRLEQVKMFDRVKSILTGLEKLRDVVNEINL